MRLVQKVTGAETVLMVWRRIRGDIEHPSGLWFARSFIAAASVVVVRWGPRWARWSVGGGGPIGAWLLLALWLGLPLVLLRRLW